MAVGFPPVSVFPLEIDSDRTLFLVYDTAQSVLTVNNPAWSEEIEIQPVGAEEEELWADNGFANISGELFYYDSVQKDENGKVFKLKRCARSIGGEKTRFNPTGTYVRGLIVAEHHNQLVDAVIKTERFIGIDECEDEDTLECRLQSIDTCPICVEDFDCPVVVFSFSLDENEGSNCEGIIANYNVEIQGTFTNFLIDFGDGNTTTETSGQHVYAINASIDPVVTVSNSKCEIVQTPNARDAFGDLPENIIDDLNLIPIPIIEPFPDVSIPDFDIASPDLEFPPITFPCLAFDGIDLAIALPSLINALLPSLIVFDPLPNIPSTITFIDAPNIPSVIEFIGGIDIPSVIEFTNLPDIPDTINFGPAPTLGPVNWGTPPTLGPVNFGPVPSFNRISFAPCPSCVVTFGPAPTISVDWGVPPILSCYVSVICPSSAAAAHSFSAMSLGDEFIDEFENDTIQLESESIGIPSEIKIVPPEFPEIELKHNLPSSIKVEGLEIPNIIQILGGEEIPHIIRVESNIPERIVLDASNIPEAIKLDTKDIPEFIKLAIPESWPEILINASAIPHEIRVVGIPETIELKGTIPSEITIKAPEDLEIPLVYRGGPIPLEFGVKNFGKDEMDEPCFAIIPCKK